MANGNFPPSDGYRNDRSSGERDFSRDSRDASSEYRPGDTGYVRADDQQRGRDRSVGNRDRGETTAIVRVLPVMAVVNSGRMTISAMSPVTAIRSVRRPGRGNPIAAVLLHSATSPPAIA